MGEMLFVLEISYLYENIVFPIGVFSDVELAKKAVKEHYDYVLWQPGVHDKSVWLGRSGDIMFLIHSFTKDEARFPNA